MAEEKDNSYTILEYMRDHSGYKCGYCKSKNTNFSHGMWAHQITVGDYQDLIDRGWRRSGKYCYKPTMDKTCCPMYTIKCDAVELKLSKTQKKVLKRMHRYLSHGEIKKGNDPDNTFNNEISEDIGGNQEFIKPQYDTKEDLSGVSLQMPCEDAAKISKSATVHSNKSSAHAPARVPAEAKSQDSPELSQEKKSTENKGLNPNKPPCRKAKDIRRERREAKLAKRAQEAQGRGESPMEIPLNRVKNTAKTLEDFLNEPLPENPAHTLEIRLVRSQPSSSQFVHTFKTSHEVYEKYQTKIHGDSLDRCCESQFKRFLCNSPLQLRLVRVNPPDSAFRASFNASYAVFRKYQLEIHHDTESECNKMAFQSFLVDGPLSAWHPSSGPPQGYGSFHHQYWLDGRLIAVGVLDVLPYCLSSVYLYYDPEFSFLSLGTYASLRELALTRELQQKIPSLRWYYMGFYIHSCPKMRYKGNYSPSFLLCPETYIWVPIEKAVPKLDIAKYCRFNDDSSAVDENGDVDLKQILVLHERELMKYSTFQLLNHDTEDEEEVREYATLVGAKSAYSMVLYRG
ncbi:arginyl-tRNA--protein transferase 1-like isoform X2 [Penaeus chinensis]|uniref:arginyl-tRNA--protein transferase 1-like isoform X2 n=1 Tax=Penaeus chinensis TaxID=139456 RepID=UPI001FB765B3|nr:arginyl-tRNA--protein transferase 1-like isoform X2 [Penaeus chinensis]